MQITLFSLLFFGFFARASVRPEVEAISIEEIGRLAAARTKAINGKGTFSPFIEKMEELFYRYTVPHHVILDVQDRPGSVKKVSVDSWAFVPHTYQADKKIDVIVHLHGGVQNSVFFQTPFSPKKAALELIYFAKRFMIIAVNYRGTYEEKDSKDFEAQVHDVYNCTLGVLEHLKIKNYGSIYLNGYDHGAFLAINLLAKVYDRSLDSPPEGKLYKNIFSGAILHSGIYSSTPQLADKMIPQVPILIVQCNQYRWGLESMQAFENALLGTGRENVYTRLLDCDKHIAQVPSVNERDPIFEEFIVEYERFIALTSKKFSLNYADFFLKKNKIETDDSVSGFIDQFFAKKGDYYASIENGKFISWFRDACKDFDKPLLTDGQKISECIKGDKLFLQQMQALIKMEQEDPQDTYRLYHGADGKVAMTYFFINFVKKIFNGVDSRDVNELMDLKYLRFFMERAEDIRDQTTDGASIATQFHRFMDKQRPFYNNLSYLPGFNQLAVAANLCLFGGHKTNYSYSLAFYFHGFQFSFDAMNVITTALNAIGVRDAGRIEKYRHLYGRITRGDNIILSIKMDRKTFDDFVYVGEGLGEPLSVKNPENPSTLFKPSDFADLGRNSIAALENVLQENKHLFKYPGAESLTDLLQTRLIYHPDLMKQPSFKIDYFLRNPETKIFRELLDLVLEDLNLLAVQKVFAPQIWKDLLYFQRNQGINSMNKEQCLGLTKGGIVTEFGDYNLIELGKAAEASGSYAVIKNFWFQTIFSSLTFPPQGISSYHVLMLLVHDDDEVIQYLLGKYQISDILDSKIIGQTYFYNADKGFQGVKSTSHSLIQQVKLEESSKLTLFHHMILLNAEKMLRYISPIVSLSYLLSLDIPATSASFPSIVPTHKLIDFAALNCSLSFYLKRFVNPNGFEIPSCIIKNQSMLLTEDFHIDVDNEEIIFKAKISSNYEQNLLLSFQQYDEKLNVDPSLSIKVSLSVNAPQIVEIAAVKENLKKTTKSVKLCIIVLDKLIGDSHLKFTSVSLQKRNKQ